MESYLSEETNVRENGNNASVETKLEQRIKYLYKKKNMVIHNDINTYFDIDIDLRLNDSLQSKKD